MRSIVTAIVVVCGTACAARDAELGRRVDRLENRVAEAEAAARAASDRAADLERRLGQAGIVGIGNELDTVEGRKAGDVVARWWCIGGVGRCFRSQVQCEQLRRARHEDAPADAKRFAAGDPCEPRRVAFCDGTDCSGYLSGCGAGNCVGVE